MNFVNFTGAHNHSDGYFWVIAAPVCFVVAIFLMQDMIKQYVIRKIQRRLISRSRKARAKRSVQRQRR